MNNSEECLFLSAKEERVEAGIRDRAFCTHIMDGGKSIVFLYWMTNEPISVRSVMPSTVRCSEDHLVSALRRRHDSHSPDGARGAKNWLDVYESRDNGET